MSQAFWPHRFEPAQFASLGVSQRSLVTGWLTSHGRKLAPLACSLAVRPAFVALSRLVYWVSAHCASAGSPSRVAMYLYAARPARAASSSNSQVPPESLSPEALRYPVVVLSCCRK